MKTPKILGIFSMFLGALFALALVLTPAEIHAGAFKEFISHPVQFTKNVGSGNPTARPWCAPAAQKASAKIQAALMGVNVKGAAKAVSEAVAEYQSEFSDSLPKCADSDAFTLAALTSAMRIAAVQEDSGWYNDAAVTLQTALLLTPRSASKEFLDTNDEAHVALRRCVQLARNAAR